MGKEKTSTIWKTSDRRAKWSEIWESRKIVQHIRVAGIPGSPAAICHFLMDTAGKPCDHVVSSQKV